MSTALDLAALAAQGELKIPIARGVVSEGGSGTDYTGWSGVSSVFVEAKVEVRDQSRGFATLELQIEGSSNGSDWSRLETFTFGAGGTQSATVSSPDDHLRVSWAVGGYSEWQIIEVTAAPSIIDTGGGSAPVALIGTDPLTTPLEVVGAHNQNGGGSYIFRVADFADDDVIAVTPDSSDGVALISINANTDLAPAAGSIQVAADTDISFYASRSLILFGAGVILQAVNAAPDLATLNPGDMALWFDSTNGAAKLKVTAKQADGTVVSGSLALAP